MEDNDSIYCNNEDFGYHANTGKCWCDYTMPYDAYDECLASNVLGLNLDQFSPFELYYYCKCYGKSDCEIPMQTYRTSQYFSQEGFDKNKKFVPNLEFTQDALN